LDFGDNGQVYKPSSGRTIGGLVFIVLEYVQGGLLLFDLCQTVGAAGGFGEECGRYLFTQLLDAVEHMHSRNIAHRDIKLENVLVDSKDMTLKVADFGYAAQGTEQLRSYRGTFTYMAPEIKEGRTYDGKQADLFSVGVVLFILIRGIFPFKEARKEEFFYNLLCQGKY
jgi:serine/threonine protein kinase